jgi:DNA adenine methylase
LRADSSALKKVEFVCGDFFNLIDFNSIDKNDGIYRFVYMDPPYIPISISSKFTQYTKSAFGENEQKAVNDLAHVCELYNIDVMISNSYSEGNVLNAYENFNKHIVYATRNINSNGTKRGKIPELLYTTYSDTKISHKQKSAELL